MTQAIVVRNARCQNVVGMRAGSQRDCKTDKRSRHAEAALAVDGYFGCHRFRPRPASVSDKAISAAIIPCRLDAARNAIDAIDAAQDIGFWVPRRPPNPTPGRRNTLRG